MGTVAEEAVRFAEQLTTKMKQATGIDYSSQQEFIKDWAEENMWNGDWDLTIDFGDYPAPRSLRLIEENEYDQHMDDDSSKPDYDDVVAYVDGYYVFFA